MQTAVAAPDPEPTPGTGGAITGTWTWAEPSTCYFMPASRDTARTESIWNAALAWYGIPPGTTPIVRWQT